MVDVDKYQAQVVYKVKYMNKKKNSDLKLPIAHEGKISYEAIKLSLEKYQSLTRYQYPWDGLEEEIIGLGLKELPLIGYGSLVNNSSAAQTFDNEAVSSGRPVVAFGCRRIFNYPFPCQNTRYGPCDSTKFNAALNVNVTWNDQDMINGVLINIKIDEFDLLRERELSYRILPVPFIDWGGINMNINMGYVLSRIPESEDNVLMPHKEYYKVCRQGASSFGNEFLDFWLQSTFLADNVTTVKNLENSF